MAGNVRVEQLQPQLGSAGVDVAVAPHDGERPLRDRALRPDRGRRLRRRPGGGRGDAARPRVRGAGGGGGLGRRTRDLPGDPQRPPGRRSTSSGSGSEALAARHASGGTVGYEGSSETLAPPAQAGEASAVALPTQRLIEEAFGGAELTDVTELLEATKAVKTGRELEKLEIANEIAGFGHARVQGGGPPGSDGGRDHGRGRVRDRGRGPRLPGRPRGARLCHRLLGTGPPRTDGSTSGRGRGASSPTTS